MNTYLVKVTKTQYFFVEIEADTWENAEKKASNLPDEELNKFLDDEKVYAIALGEV
jgi:hypothetical protein